jgi:hypothetical protein
MKTKLSTAVFPETRWSGIFLIPPVALAHNLLNNVMSSFLDHRGAQS